MKKAIVIIVFGLLWCNLTYADDKSTLPPCQGEDSTQFVNCYGSYVGKDYSEIHNQPGLTNDYIGEFGNSPGLSNGKGTVKIYVNGKYDGECTGKFIDDLMNGKGICTYISGNKYVGEFKDDKAHGQGTLTWADGTKYVGEWKDDKMNGQGTMTYADGTKYVGEWKDDKFHGQGTLTWADGDVYVGEWKDDKMNGQGTMTYADGEQYVGEFKDDHMHGQGTLIFASGNKYVGEFKDGKMNGQGTFTYTNGDKYVGGFKDGKRHGQGTYTFADGKITKGIWNKGELVEGKKQGCIKGDCVNRDGTYTYLDGSKYVGEFEDGKRHGKGIMTLANGKQYVAEFKDGREIADTLVVIDQRTGEERFDELHTSYQGKLPYCEGKEYYWTNCFGTGSTWFYEALYTGEWKDGKEHGKGTYSWFNDNYDATYEEYVGEFENGMGQGTLIYFDGHIYVGGMTNGRKHGEGTFKCKNSISHRISSEYSNLKCKPGRIITAIWQNGKLIDVLNINF